MSFPVLVGVEWKKIRRSKILLILGIAAVITYGDAMDSFHFERPFEFWDAGGRNFPRA